MSWMTLAEAAVALNYSERTVRRKIKDGVLQAVREKGRILVNIDGTKTSDCPEDVSVHLVLPVDDTQGLGSTSGIVPFVSATLSRYENDVDRARRSARSAWAILAIAIGGVGWVSFTYHREVVVHQEAMHQQDRRVETVQRQVAAGNARSDELRVQVQAEQGRSAALAGAVTELSVDLSRSQDLVSLLQQRQQELVEQLDATKPGVHDPFQRPDFVDRLADSSQNRR